MAQLVKSLPAMWETWVRSLGQEDPLEKEMATYSSILAWEIPWTEEPGGLQSVWPQSHDLGTQQVQVNIPRSVYPGTRLESEELSLRA